MNQPLFLDEHMRFDGEEKIAGMMHRLSDNVDNWQQEIIQEAYKRLPFLSNFEVHVLISQQDEERGFAFGAIQVSPKSAMTVDEASRTGLDKVHIPIVIKEQMLSPLDVFIEGKKYQYLTEARLRAALFRPELFDVVRTKPHDPSLVQDIHPPTRSGGFGGGTKLGADMTAGLPLLPQLYGRISQAHANRFKTAMENPTLKTYVANSSDGVKAAFASALRLSPSDRAKTAQAVADNTRPTVVQLQKLSNSQVRVKWATGEMFAPQENDVPMSVAQDMMGDEDMTGQLESNGTVTMSPEANVKQTLEAEEIRVADSFGIWSVQEVTGKTMVGWVFPNLLSLSLEVLPLSLFTNGSNFALQEHVAGSMTAKSTDIPKGLPKGYGALYYLDHGTAKAFVPMNITSTGSSPAGEKYIGETDMGEQITFSFAEGLKKPQQVSEGEWVVPNFFNWIPLTGKVELVSEPALFSKLAADSFSGTVDILGDGTGTYSFRGPAVAKIASDHTKFIDHNKAMFMGVALGMTEEFCKTALTRASKGESVPVGGLKVLSTVREKMASYRKEVLRDLSKIDPPIHNYDLIKEASILDDALTADKILALGFLNAENVATFVDLLPALDAASSKMAELLIAVRIGLEEVPEVAVERMLAALEDVVRGLKSLQQKELTFAN